MKTWLRNHPFSIEAFFEKSVVLTFAVPKEIVQHRLPRGLVLDLFQDQWAFMAVALVKTKGLRIKGLPTFFGQNFILVGFRFFVRYKTSEGKNLRGLFILKSQTDSARMAKLGNRMTHYNYSQSEIDWTVQGDQETIQLLNDGTHIEFKTGESKLPEQSPFDDWKQARRFAGPLPHTFTNLAETNEMLIIEGVRQNWTPQPITVMDFNIPFVEEICGNQAVLASAFQITEVPYSWKKGRKDQITQ